MAKKKENTIPGARSLLAVLTLAIIAALGWWWFKSSQPDFIRYDAFGIEIPANFSIHGIDVSKYQQRINWEAVKEMEVDDVRIGFVFIKATEGLGNMDGYFRRNWDRRLKPVCPVEPITFLLRPKAVLSKQRTSSGELISSPVICRRYLMLNKPMA